MTGLDPHKPASPRGQPLLGHFLQLRRDPLGLLLRAQAECGGLAVLRVGPMQVHAVFHPDGVRRVLVDNVANYGKGPLYALARPMLGQGLLLSEGALWRRQRRLAQPTFHAPRLAGMAPWIVAEAEKLAARWQLAAAAGRPVEVAADLLGLSLAAISGLIFGGLTGDAAAIADDLPGVIRHIERSMSLPLPLLGRLPTPANRRFRAAVAHIDGAIARMISGRRDAPGDDLLARLLAARDDETGLGMDDRQLLDEVKTLLLAGFDTTGHAMAWTLHALAHAPESQRRVQAELDAVLGGRAPVPEDIPRLVVGAMAVREALRLYPPIWSFARQCVADDELLGRKVPAGAHVTINPYVTHRVPEFWPDPERFDLERFTPAAIKARPRLAYFPFGGGSRQCVGQSFAELEIHLALAVLLQRFTVAPLPGRTATPLASLSLRPRDGIHLRLTARA